MEKKQKKPANWYTDEKKKMAVADFVQMQNYSAVARKHKVSPSAVKKWVKELGGLTEECEEKNRQNTENILQYMQDCSEKVKVVIASCLEALADPEKIRKAPLKDIATAMGIVIDKFTGVTQLTMEEQRVRIANIKAQTAKIKGEDVKIKSDDGFIDALKREAAEAWDEEKN